MTSYLKTMLAGLRKWITAQKADWNQNDEMAANYIKGRPCYEDDSGKAVPLPAKYLPPIPAEKLPTIPAEKLGKTFVIKCNTNSYTLFSSFSSTIFTCGYGHNTALYAAQMLRDQKAVIETTDGCRFTPCTNADFDESGDSNYITFVLIDTIDNIVKIVKCSIMSNGYIIIQRSMQLTATEVTG